MLGLALASAGLGTLVPNFAAESLENQDYTRKNHEVPSITKAATIDGLLNEPEWQQALKVDLVYETNPGDNVPAKQKTTAYIYENGSNMYVAFRAEDTNAREISSYIRDRDSAYSDDFVGVQFDTFNDEQRAYEFFVNAHGSQMDLVYDESSDNEDDSWDAIWDSAATRDENGYTVEMEIPFSNLRFPSGNQKKTWSMEFIRIYPREQRYIFRNSKRDRNKNCAICNYDKFSGFENAKQGNQLELNPILTIARSESRNPDTGNLESNGTDYEPGLNVRWGITPEMTLNATINPDFSQVEADDAQLNVNNTFALFFQEKRPFFQEGSDYFNTNLNAVYTRNVADPEYGVKLTGRSGAHTFGTFAVRDEVTNIIVPGKFGSDFIALEEASNDFVTRYRYDINKDFNVGGLVTYRGAGDYENTVLGFDTFYRWQDKHRVQFQYLTTDTDNNIEMQDDLSLAETQSGDAYRISYNYNARDYFAYTNYVDFDKDFRADLGFLTRNDYDKFVIGGGRVWYPENKWFNRIQLSGDWDITHDNSGNLLEKEIEGALRLWGKKQSFFLFGFFDADTRFLDTMYPVNGVYSFAEFRPRPNILIGGGFNMGERIDFRNQATADSFLTDPRINWSVNEHLQFNLSHRYRTLETDNIRKLTANLTDLRATYQFSNKSFLRLTAQYENIENELLDAVNIGQKTKSKGFNKQLLYSYKLSPRTVFFLGYSDLADNDNPQDDLEVQQRGLFMKLGYVFDY